MTRAATGVPDHPMAGSQVPFACERAGLIALAAFLLTLLAGCGALQKEKYTEMMWPAPPLTPRIKFVGLIRNRDDLGRSAADLFADALLGKKPPERLVQPMGVAPSRDGKRLYVTDYGKPAVLVFDFETRRMSPFGGEANVFQSPLGIALDDEGNVYIVDCVPKRIGVYDPNGALLRNITHESLERPTGIAVDSVRRRIYVADSATKDSRNHMVRVFDLDGSYLKSFGGLGSEAGKFSFPSYLTVDAEGNLYVTDTLNGRVQKFDPDGRHLKTFGQFGDAFGMFDKPKGVALDAFGNLYVVDAAWSNVQIFNQQGQVLLFFGGRGRFPGLLFNPTGIAMDRDNRIYVADAFNGRVSIYQLINTKAEDSFTTVPPQPKEPKEGGDSRTRENEGISSKGGDSRRIEKTEARSRT